MMAHYDLLIIDDSPDDHELCQQAIQPKKLEDGTEVSYEMHRARNRHQGLTHIAEKNTHCVLLSYALPDVEDKETLHVIRQQYPDLPIIILANQGSERLAVELLKSGAKDYLLKSDLQNLDLATIIHTAINAHASSHNTLNKTSVLIVDDCIEDRDMIMSALQKSVPYHYRFIEAGSGLALFERIEEQMPQCILLDYNLAGEDGLEILKKLTERYPFIPVIVVTGEGTEVIAAQAIKNGASHYLTKAEISPELLDKTIKQELKNKHLEQVVYEKSQEVRQYQYEAIARKNRLDRIVEAVNITVWEYDLSQNQFYIGEMIENLLGESVNSEKITLKQLREYIHHNDREALDHQWQTFINGEEDEWEVIYRLRHKNGYWCWIRESGKVISRDKDNHPKQIVGLYEDINEKKCQEEAVNQFYSLTVDNQLTSEEKMQQVLQLGVSYFDVELASVSRIYNEDYLILHSEPAGLTFTNRALPYTQTYCAKIFDSTLVKSWHNGIDGEQLFHPAYPNQAINTYLGTTLFVNNAPYGTLAFVKKESRKRPFSNGEKNLLRLMAQWVSSEIAAQLHLNTIAESERFLSMMQDVSPNLIFVKDEEFRLVRANKAFLNLYPEPMRDSVIGTTTVESYNKEEAEAFLYQDKLAFEQGISEIEETILFPDGKERTLHTLKTRFQDSENNNYILGVAHDITDIKQAVLRVKESEERYELAVKGSSVGLWDWNVRTGELFWSERFKEIVDVPTNNFQPHFEDFVGRLHPEDKEKVLAAITNHLENKTPYDIEYRLQKEDDSYVWIHARGQAIWDKQGSATRMAGSVDDITQSKKAQEELIRSNLELERFAYMASHDLQEPLRMVSNFSQLLEKNYKSQLDERASEYIDYVCNAATRMQQLIKDLLEYARLGNNTEGNVPVSLNKLKKSIEENLAQHIKQTNTQLEWSSLPTILADPVIIASVFQNIISNAIKYRKADISPRITVSVAPLSTQWQFAISDNGIGMKPKYCEKIFEPFKRLHRKEEYGGTGMGLAICRKSLEEFGGKIWVKSELGKGSTFYFTLPKMPSRIQKQGTLL